MNKKTNLMVDLVCSNKLSSPTQGGSAAWWKRDTHHGMGERGKTLCGRNADGWIKLHSTSSEEAVSDSDFCSRCAAWLIKNGY